ncbi:TetR family transcriptional regulator [Paenibacillus rhizophilus]|uniref:TetR family transcriptional regulator n=1 Tax=Paenibacillus rhizophilus TaxID=1850366 RepID=A0A3N9PCL4_9BACL|nr:TetR family transcriptional regulator [Paenibacillus rhizophilus]RQW13619.1 TetR family transcriptional regulator [Paenibacillus rhizophilus]
MVTAAAQIADEYGMEGVTLAALVAKLGMRSPSLYNHINGQSGLTGDVSDSLSATHSAFLAGVD